MDNAEIARFLAEIADLLNIAGENVFKVRSYERAAETVAALPQPVEKLAADGALTGIPGIGKSIAEVITEVVTTGQSSYREQLLEAAPEGLLEMLRIPGFGPRKAGQVYHELGISSLAELETAAREGQLRGLKGFGAKTEEKILEGLAQLRAGQERALALGLMVSQRNMGLMLAATDGALPGLTWLYFALSQFPIYVSPQLLKPLARRLQETSTAPP